MRPLLGNNRFLYAPIIVPIIFRVLPLLMGVIPLYAQNEHLLITSLVIEGNELTQEHIITRELSHPLNQPFDSSIVHEDRNRLYNLGIFEWVNIYQRQTGPDEAALVIEVVETFRLIPYPAFYHLPDLGWSYGGGLMVNNFRGLNQRLNIGGTVGAEVTYFLMFNDPWIIGERVAIDCRAMQTYRNHPEYDFRYGEQVLSAGLGKYFSGRTILLSSTVGLYERSVDWSQENLHDSTEIDFQDRVFQATATFLWRTTDIWRDPTRGFRLLLELSPVMGLNNDSPTYGLLGAQGAVFFPLLLGDRPLVLGTALMISHATGPTPIYSTQYLGGMWVRGYNVDPQRNPGEVRDRLRCTSVIFSSMELRKTLIPRQLYDQTELGISAVLFMDAGWGYGPDQSLMKALPLIGFGAGIRFFLPNLEALALDVGLNPYDYTPRYRLRLNQKF